MKRSFLMVLENPVDFLVCFESRNSRFCRLDIHPERGNSLINLVYTTDRANLRSSMRIVEKIALYTLEG